MAKGFLTADQWRRVQRSVPIVCVDVAPVQRSQRGVIERIGLILRDTPHQGRRWCLVGGRVRFDETIAEALRRHLRETLGPAARYRLGKDPQPDHVEQYFPRRRSVGLLDPRQHSVALTFVLDVTGRATPGGEAHRFEWFGAGDLPSPRQFGFGQDRALRAALSRHDAARARTG